MRQATEAELQLEVQRHTIGNRAEIEASKFAGCLSCCAVFDASQVKDWRDEWTSPDKRNRVKRWTGQCPSCGQPAVIGSGSGLLEDQSYLPVMHDVFARFRGGERNGS